MMNIISKKQYKVGITALALILTLGLAMWASYVYGEQSGGAPESGSDSYIQSLYTDLQTSGFGDDNADPDWGTYWNRLNTAAHWVPDGTATAEEVTKGKTFFDYTRGLQTGTYAPGNCPTQQYQDNHGAPTTATTNCVAYYSSWDVPSDGITGTDQQDARSGLIWSYLLYKSGSTVVFNQSGNSTWSWDASAANNIAVGNKTALTLCSGMGNGWRLPTQKELVQAYIDGAYWRLTQTSSRLWSATQHNASASSIWAAYLTTGSVVNVAKGTLVQVRCVR